MFNTSFFKYNRKKLLQLAGTDCIVMTAAGLLQKSADTAHSFKQDTSFWYMTGIDQPDYVLLITKNRHYIIAPKRDSHRDLWEGIVDTEALIKLSGVDEVLTYSQGQKALQSLLHDANVGIPLPAKKYLSAYGMYTNPARLLLFNRVKRYSPQSVVDIRQHVAAMRQIKTKDEITSIQKAVDITKISLDYVKNHIHNAQTEKDIEHMLTYAFGMNGAQGHAYQPIIAADTNATTIHYVANNASLKNKTAILFDVGAEFNHYAADISRVYAITQPSQRYRDVYMHVLHVQQQLVASLKPGMTLQKFEQSTVALLSDAVKKLGLSNDIRQYYPHAVSHHLGLDVHDSADYTAELVPGMVITVEPGLYISQEGIGVRIEDDIVITETGSLNLSKNIPYDLLYCM